MKCSIKKLIEQVDSFHIGQYAVTNREFCEFLNDVTEGGGRNPSAASICEIRYFSGPELRIRDIGFRIVRIK